MIKDIEKTVKTITDEIKNFTDFAVVGISGGADSTLITTLCTIALGKENVCGIHMPYSVVDKEKFNSNSIAVANKLGIKQMVFDIGDPMDAFFDKLEKDVQPLSKTETKLSILNQGNGKSRMRAMSLYTINQHISESLNKRCRVIGTGNMSEDFIGYDTKGGDALADIFPIGELFKSEVYQLLDYFVSKKVLSKDMIDKTPSAGLWEGQTDEDELGYSYNEMEPAIEFCIANYKNMNDINLTPIVEFVWNRHVVNKHKHMAPFVVKLGEVRK